MRSAYVTRPARAPGLGGSEWHPVQLAASMEATSQGTPVAAAAPPPSPDDPGPPPELLALPELDDGPTPDDDDDVPGPDEETPPEELAAAEAPAEPGPGAGAPGTTMTCGSDAEGPHALRMTQGPPQASAVTTLARWAVTGLNMDVTAPVHRSDQRDRPRISGQSRCHPLADAITVIKTITPPPVLMNETRLPRPRRLSPRSRSFAFALDPRLSHHQINAQHPSLFDDGTRRLSRRMRRRWRLDVWIHLRPEGRPGQ
jgi:hypothetical protein